MKKGLMLTTALAMALGVGVAVSAHQEVRQAKADPETRDLYLNIIDTSDFLQGNERFAVYAFNGGGNHWYDMSQYAGSNFYKASIDTSYTTVILCRMDGSVLENDWPNKWDQSDDLILSASTTYFKATSKPADGKIGGEWYDATVSEDTNLFYAYDKNQVLGAELSGVKIYGFGNNLVLPDIWPGTNDGISSSEQGGRNAYRIELSTSYSKFILNGNSHQTVDVEDLGDHLGDVLIIGAANDQGKYTVSWQELEDFNDHPATEGYYLLGTKSSWKFAGSTQIPSIVKDAHNNVAILSDYVAAANEEIRVRSYKNDAKDWLECVTDSIEDVGSKVGDNFVFSASAHVDIFVFDDNGVYKFSVAEHAELLTITVKNKLFEGSQLVSTTDAPNQDCVKGAEFIPTPGHQDGYVFRGYFTDASCSTRFDDETVVENDLTLYAKYTKIGYYITGDATYAGSEALAWNVDGAKILSDTVNDPANMLEGSVTIPNSASKETPVKVKALHYVYDNEHPLDGKWDAMTFNMGAEYSFIELDEESNFCFSKGGTYAIYVKLVNYVPTVWVNEGIEAFHTKFLSEVGATCSDIVGGTKTMEQLKDVWAEQKAAYQSLSSTEKAVFEATNIDAGNEDGTQIEKVIAKYSYIVHKYGTNNFEDFIWGQSYDPNSLGSFNFRVSDNNSTLIIVIASVSVMALSFGLVMMLKKKER